MRNIETHLFPDVGVFHSLHVVPLHLILPHSLHLKLPPQIELTPRPFT